MNMSQEEHSNVPHECYQEQIQELAESCDNEYYMSTLPSATNKERTTRGQARILQALEDFRELQQNTNCAACLDEINKQITLQAEGLKEIELAWKL
jgi:hypothetical protein